jgi:hypothetical protein
LEDAREQFQRTIQEERHKRDELEVAHQHAIAARIRQAAAYKVRTPRAPANSIPAVGIAPAVSGLTVKPPSALQAKTKQDTQDALTKSYKRLPPRKGDSVPAVAAWGWWWWKGRRRRRTWSFWWQCKRCCQEVRRPKWKWWWWRI